MSANLKRGAIIQPTTASPCVRGPPPSDFLVCRFPQADRRCRSWPSVRAVLQDQQHSALRPNTLPRHGRHKHPGLTLCSPPWLAASHGAKQFPTSVAPCGRSNVAPIRRLLGRLQFYKQPFLRICLLWLVHAVRRNTTPLALPASAAPVKGGCEASLRHSSQESRRYCLALAPRAPRWNALPGITRTRAGMRAWNVGRVESAELMAARRYASLPSDLGRRHVFATYRRGYRGLRSSSEIEGSSRGTESATLQMRSCYRAFPIFARVIYMHSNGRHLYSLMRWRSRKPLGSGYFNRWNVVIKCVYS